MGISLNPATLLSGQGLDVATLVNQILGQQTGSLQQWEQEQSQLQTQAGLLTSINNDLSSLQTAVTALSDPLGALTGQSATSSSNSILTASAQSTALTGTHQIVVNNLATTGTTYTDQVANGDTSFLPSGETTGEIDLQIGGSGGTTHAITITAGSNDTLNTLASYINGQAWGVTASVITDANGSRLALFSQATGTPGALAITGNTTSLNFNPPTGGVNASLTIDGVPFSSSTNIVSGALSGVTLNLVGASPGTPVQLTVGPNTTQATQAINNFVTAYNQVINDINQQFTVNTATNSEGPLGSDSALRQLQSSILSDVTYSVAGNGGYINLASLGIDLNNDGTLTVNSSELNAAFAANPDAVQNFFQNSSTSGFANNFQTDITALTDATQGPLNVDLAQNKTQQQSLTTSINNFEDQLAAEQQALTTQYSQVNASLQAYPLLLQQVTETLGSLSSGSSSSGSSSPVLTSGL